MTEYELNILRSEQVLDSLDIAINVLDNYKHHSLGQPVTLLYKKRDSEGKEVVKLVLAIGKKSGGGDKTYYEIINSDIDAECNCRYISSHGLDEKTYSDVGAVPVDTTLKEIYRRTNNGDFSMLFDYIFFKEKATPPTIILPSIVDFYIEGVEKAPVVKLKEVPSRSDFKVIVSRGEVSHGTAGDNQPYAGEYRVSLHAYEEIDGEEVELRDWSDMYPGNDYTIRAYVDFNIGTNQPLDSDNHNYGTICTITQLFVGMKIEIEESLFGYAGMVYDHDLGFQTKIWSKLDESKREKVIQHLIDTESTKYSIKSLNAGVDVSGFGTIDDAALNKGRLIVVIPKAMSSKLATYQYLNNVPVPYFMETEMEIEIEGIPYVAYMTASQYAIMTNSNVFRVQIEK